MNFRITTLFFALLLTMLWVFGLMIAHKKAAGDQSFLLPSLNAADVKIEKVQIKTTGKGRDKEKDKEPAEYEFDLIGGERWVLKDRGKQQVRVEGFKIDNLIKQIRSAKHDETADVSKDPKQNGLDAPKLIVTLSGKDKGGDKEWQFLVGNESAGMAYVSSSERPGKVFAVPSKSIESLFIKDPNYLRSKRLFDFGETGVTKIEAKKGDKELELTRGEGSMWTFVKPPYGIAGFESEPEVKKKDPFHKEPPAAPATGGVKGLLNSIIAIRVEEETDFVPLGKPAANYGLETGKETMRIEISSTQDNKPAVETLLIGEKVPDRIGDFYYARLESDDGVMQISSKWLDPIFKALNDPGQLRSRDIAAFDPKQVDAVVLKQGKAETQFFRSEEKAEPKFPMMQPAQNWQMVLGSEKEKKKEKASDLAVSQLILQVLGKKAIVKFDDGSKADLKKKEADWGLNPPVAEISVFIDGIDKNQKEAKKDEPKKDEPKKDALPALKKAAKAEVTLAIGMADKNDATVVHVRRTLKDGTESYFTVKKELVEKLLPAEGVELAYLDTSLPVIPHEDIVAVQLQRTTDKGTDPPLDLERRGAGGKEYWYLVEKAGAKLADLSSVDMVVDGLARLPVKKWLKKLDDKEDFEKYGLKKPTIAAKITVKNTAGAAAGLFGTFAFPQSLVTAAAGVLFHRELASGKVVTEVVTIEIGNPTDNDKDKPAYYARRSGSNLLFLVPSEHVKFIRDKDLHDRSSILYSQVSMEAMCKANGAVNPTVNLWMFASPYFSGVIQQIDPDKVTDIRLSVRTPFELRAFHFERIEKVKEKAEEKGKGKDDKGADKEKDKDKPSKWTWIDKSTGLQEFQVDPDRVAQLIKDFAKLRTDRFASFAGAPRGEYKLSDKDASVKLDLTLEDKTNITVTIGTSYPPYGHFATSSAWPDVVFFVPSATVSPILRGISHFSKERPGAN
jgi:hypothetical protein